jgi:hypothetical protein
MQVGFGMKKVGEGGIDSYSVFWAVRGHSRSSSLPQGLGEDLYKEGQTIHFLILAYIYAG